MFYDWPYPCPQCGGTMQVERDGKHKHFVCECGVDIRIADDGVGEWPPVAPDDWAARVGHYERVTCVYCDKTLTGRQKRYCSHRCRMRDKRKAHKPSQ